MANARNDDKNQDKDKPDKDKPDKDKPDKDKPHESVTITIRTPGNIPSTFDVRDHDRVDKVAREAVDYFVGRNELAAGAYGLAVIRDGQGVEMNDAARLEDYDVIDGDELHLINRAPQVDG